MNSSKEFLQALDDAIALARGDKTRARERVVMVPRKVDVRAIRHRLGMSQTKFAAQFGFSVATVRNWEQGHRRPEGPSRVLLTIIERIPDEVKRALLEPLDDPDKGAAV
jgi:putative transcriptional regulator